MKYQIVAEYIICGKACECLCDTPTASGNYMITFNKEIAERRVAELNALGMKARYEELSTETTWFDDDNWIG